MQSEAVVEDFDVIKHGGARFGERGEAMMVNEFVLEAAPKRLDEGVIVAVALASHGSEQPVLGQGLAVRRTNGAAGTRATKMGRPRGRYASYEAKDEVEVRIMKCREPWR